MERSAPAVWQLQAWIAPLRLPEQLLEFWRLVHPPSLSPVPFPFLASPADLLMFPIAERFSSPGRTTFADPPRALLEIGYESHEFLLVELVDDAQPGSANGALWRWGCGATCYRLAHLSVSGYLDLLAVLMSTDG